MEKHLGNLKEEFPKVLNKIKGVGVIHRRFVDK
jgi:hypothetical protein